MDDRDKRDYYRLSDTILVEFALITERDTHDAQPGDFFTSDPNFHLLRDIYELQLESKQLSVSLAQTNRELGKFLGNLDRQVELIAKAVATRDIEKSPLKLCDAEISEGGVSFLHEKLIEINQYLAIRLLFQPSMLGLTAFCQVKHCQLQENGYRIGVQFEQTDLQTQRIISRHIISKQSEQRRSRLNRS